MSISLPSSLPTPELDRDRGRQRLAEVAGALARQLGDQARIEERAIAPAGVEALAELVRWAARERVPLCTQGCPCSALPVDLGRLNALRFYEPADLTLGIEAGATVAALLPRLSASRQMLPLETPLDGAPGRALPTLNAILAQHLSGPLRHQFGTVRDFTLGIEMVAADGSIVHGGGRVVKNVAGYDLMKLAIGAGDTLGIITAANLRVFPALTTTETLVIDQPGDGGDVWQRANRLRAAVQRSPLRLLALEWRWQPAAVRLLARYQGSETVRRRVREELGTLADREGGLKTNVVDQANEAAFWTPPGGAEGGLLLRIGFPAAEIAVRLPRLLAALATLAADDEGAHRLEEPSARGRLLEGSCEFLIPAPAIPAPDRADAAWLRARLALAELDAGDVSVRAHWLGTPCPLPARAITPAMRGLKQAFDPSGILNPAQLGRAAEVSR